MNFIKTLSLIFILLAGIACKEDNDSNPPIISIIKPSNGDLLEIGDTLYFKADFYDNADLRSYKLDIHSAQGHQHTRSVVDFWSYTHEHSFSSGLQSKTEVLEIPIPKDIRTGDYHLVVYCTDNSGNESTAFIEMDLTEAEIQN